MQTDVEIQELLNCLENRIVCKKENKKAYYEFQWWNKNIVLSGSYISFDLETELIKTVLDIPKVALGMAYDGKTLVLIHPSKLAEFLTTVKNRHLIGHNIQFDFWACHKHLIDNGEKIAARVLWDLGNKSLLHDTMILDQLIQLGTGYYRKVGGGFSDKEAKIYSANLGLLAQEANTVELDKTDEYRLRFGELLGFTEEEIKNHTEYRGFISYALPDVIATYDVYFDVKQKAIDLMKKAGYKKGVKKYEIHPDSLDKYGPLSEAIQVRGSITLAQLGRRKLTINQEERKKLEQEERDLLTNCFKIVEERNPAILKRYGARARKAAPFSYKFTAKSGLPQFSDTDLKIELLKESVNLGVEAPLSKGKKKGLSTSAKDWVQWKDSSPFLTAWCSLEKHAKLLEFLVKLNNTEVYTNYNLLMRTGRTSASKHRKNQDGSETASVNIQQIPRDKRLRNLFIAEDDKVLFSCDYGYLELRTLAGTCKGRFGFSDLGDVIVKHTKEGGLDPHEIMACSLGNLSLEDWPKLDKNNRKELRQAAKAVNFGNPGGLGKVKLVEYSKANYNVVMSETEAKAAKTKWMTTYSEMKLHLQDYTAQALAYNLNVYISKVRDVFPGKGFACTLKAFASRLYDGNPKEEELIKILSLLINHRQDLIWMVEKKRWLDLHRELFSYRACTLTGRVRGKVGYCDGCNSPFQGLASDGSKEAIWRLMYKGYDVLMFIHDEIVVSLDKKTAERDSKIVEKIMCEEMEKVIGQDIPVACEGHIAPYWVKG